METAGDQYQKMTQMPVEKLIPRLAAPTMMSMMSAVLYNTADTWFVSQLGDSATAATGVCLPLTAMIQAVGFWIGMGAGSNISRFLQTAQFQGLNNRDLGNGSHCVGKSYFGIDGLFWQQSYFKAFRLYADHYAVCRRLFKSNFYRNYFFESEFCFQQSFTGSGTRGFCDGGRHFGNADKRNP